MDGYLEITNTTNLLEIVDSENPEITLVDVPSALIIENKEASSIEISEKGIPGKDGYLGGWAAYVDSEYTVSNKRLIPANTRTRLTNNALAPGQLRFKPENSSWWDTTQNKFFPDKYGDIYLIRVNINVSSPFNNRTVTLDFDQGTAAPPVIEDFFISKGADVVHKFSFNITLVASMALMANNGTINITCNSDLYIWGTTFLIVKVFEDVT